MLKRSLLISTIQLVSSVSIELVSLAVLARLLTPEDMGFFAAGFALVMMTRFFCSFGLYEYLIQADEITVALRRSTLGLGLLAAGGGFALLAIIALFAPAGFVPPEVRQFLIIASCAVLVHPMTILPMAVLHRAMRFGAVFAVTTAGSAVFAGTAIVLALNGFGSDSMAWATMANVLVFAVLANIATRFQFFVLPSTDSWRIIAKASSPIFTHLGADAITRASLPILIGQVAGYTALGLYSRASDLVKQFDRAVGEAVQPVLTPFLRREIQDDQAWREAYNAKLTYLGVVFLPACGLLILFSQTIVSIMLGQQWGEVVPLLQILALNLLALPFIAGGWSFVVALKLQRPNMMLFLVVSVVRLVGTVGLAAVSLKWACVAFVASHVLHAYLLYRLLSKRIGLTPRSVFAPMARNLLVTALTLAGPVLAYQLPLPPGPGGLGVAAVAGLLAGVSWFAAIWACDHPLKAHLQSAIGRVYPVRRVNNGQP